MCSIQKQNSKQDDDELRRRLIAEVENYWAPDNDRSGYLSFGEVIILNEGSKAFNEEMTRSGDLQLAQAICERVEEHVQNLADNILHEFEQKRNIAAV